MTPTVRHSTGIAAYCLALLCACAAAVSGGDGADEAAVAGALAEPVAARLAKPTPEQAAWADMELEMFLCLDPASWQGEE